MFDWFGVCMTIATVVFSFAALFAGVGYFRQGKTQGKLDANNLLQQDVDALTKKVNTQTVDIESLTKKVTDLQHAVEEKDKKITEFMQIFQGRDPQMQEFLKLMKGYIEANVPLLKIIGEETIPTIKQLKYYLDNQRNGR